MQALEDKKLNGKPRSKFITTVAQSIFVFKNYPTDDEYTDVGRELMKKWPFLDTGSGMVSY